MKKKGRGPRLNLLDKSEVLTLLLEFMACRLFSFNNQQSTVRGYLAAIKFFHKLYLGWELTTSHCIIAAAGKEIDRFRGMSGKNAQVRLPLTWSILAHGYHTVTSFQEGRRNVVRSGVVVLPAVPSVRTIRVREWARAPGLLFNARLLDFLSWRSPG